MEKMMTSEDTQLATMKNFSTINGHGKDENSSNAEIAQGRGGIVQSSKNTLAQSSQLKGRTRAEASCVTEESVKTPEWDVSEIISENEENHFDATILTNTGEVFSRFRPFSGAPTSFPKVNK